MSCTIHVSCNQSGFFFEHAVHNLSLWSTHWTLHWTGCWRRRRTIGQTQSVTSLLRCSCLLVSGGFFRGAAFKEFGVSYRNTIVFSNQMKSASVIWLKFWPVSVCKWLAFVMPWIMQCLYNRAFPQSKVRLGSGPQCHRKTCPKAIQVITNWKSLSVLRRWRGNWRGSRSLSWQANESH